MRKRKSNLYSQIYSIENLIEADRIAQRGKKHQPSVVQHILNKEDNIQVLHEMLVNKTYKTSEYRTFDIFEPKHRIVSCLPYFPDRICHHAIMNILEPVFMNTFTANTYSSIKGKGVHAASRDLKKALQDVEGTKYCLKIDIRQYYPSIDHDILKGLLRKKFKDIDLLNLLDEIIDSSPGLPIGHLTSQNLGNFYLSYFDHWIKQEMSVKYFFRYADDIVVLMSSKEELHRLLQNIREYFLINLKLEVKDNYQIFPVSSRGIDFCGYVHYHEHTRIRKSIKKRFARMLKSNYRNDKSVASYTSWLKHGNTINLRRKLLNAQS